VNATLTVDADAEYGVHQGSISFVDAGGFSHEVPYSYTVEMDLTGAEGAAMTLVDGAGPEVTPYDTGTAITYFTPGTDSTQEGGGFTTFHIDIPYNIAINASVLVMRAEWMNAGTVVDMALRTETGATITMTDDGGRPFDPNPTGTLTNTIIWAPDELINGTYWFEYNIHVFDGATVPEPITITFQLYGNTSLQPGDPGFTWTANDHVSPTTIAPNDVLTGDHVVIESSWSIPAVSGLPEYSIITNSRLSFLQGLYVSIDGIYADPQGYDAWPVPLANIGTYNWETVDGIRAEDVVHVSIDSQNAADPAIQVYPWDDINLNGEVELDELGTRLVNEDQGTTGGGESGVFTAAEDMSIAILVFNFAYVYQPGVHYTLIVDSRVSLDIDSEAGSPEYTSYETYDFLRDITFSVYLYCWTETDVAWVLDYGLVRFENFFAPVVVVNAPIDLTGDLWNFTWTASDANIFDTLYFSVWLSTDGGNTFQLRAQNITETFFVWDSDGFLIRDYVYRVRAYDVDAAYLVGGVPLSAVDDPPTSYWPGLVGESVSGAFEAGNVEPPPSTTSTTSTIPTTSTLPPSDFDPLLIGLIGGIGVGVVILLILFLIRKK
jgi:hypothetical protein